MMQIPDKRPLNGTSLDKKAEAPKTESSYLYREGPGGTHCLLWNAETPLEETQDHQCDRTGLPGGPQEDQAHELL